MQGALQTKTVYWWEISESKIYGKVNFL